MNATDRQLARVRAGGRCEYCRLPDWLPPLEPFHLEHIIARQHSGQSDLKNQGDRLDEKNSGERLVIMVRCDTRG